MSEVQSRSTASRGRSSHRTSRGGHTSRGGGRPSTRQMNGEAGDPSASVSLDDQGELGQLKKQYKTEIDTLKELFPDWTDNDLVLALQESDGDLQSTIEKITEGKVSRFEDVKTAKEKSRSKPKEAQASTSEQPSASSRGRARGGLESSRGAKGRTERARTRSRGARGAAATTSTNGLAAATTTQKASVPTTEAWADSSPDATVDLAQGEGVTGGHWGSVVTSETTPATASEGQKSSLIPEGTKKSWASMLAAPKPAPPPAKAAVPAPPAPDVAIQREVSVVQEPVLPVAVEPEPLPAPIRTEPMDIPYSGATITSADITPPKDRLTEDNVESLPDASMPPPTETTASTRDARSAMGGSTPYATTPQGSAPARPPMGGYATTAWKAAGVPGRSASYQRRMMEQQEAVVMPGNHAVDRATVQFGSMGLNGDNKPVDVDEDREDAETRAQPPQQSPSLPRASLPPAPPQQPMVADPQLPVNARTPRQAPGLPPSTQPLASNLSNAPVSNIPQGPSSMQQPPQSAQSYNQYGRYAPGALGQEAAAPSQKSYDPFNQQAGYSHGQQDTQGLYPGQSQPSAQIPQQGQSSGFPHGPSEYGSQFGTDQQRSAYQSYYSSSYGQQGFAGQQEQQGLQTQRSGSGFGASAETTLGGSQTGQTSSRFGEGAQSGHNTPAPTGTTQPPMTSQSQQAQTMPQHAPGQGPGGNFPYGNPYYTSSYYGQYMNQFPNYSYNQQGYGGHYGGKGQMYGQPHHGYGMSPQTNFDHSGSQSSTFGSSLGRESGFPGGLGEYGRSGSGQQPSAASAGAFQGGMGDTFGRGTGGFSNQSQQQYSHSQPPGTGATAEESLRSFQDTTKTGPSPSSLGGFAGRSGSSSGGYGAANASNFPPQHQSHHGHHQQAGYSGYPSHLSHLHGSHAGSQYGGAGLGGLGGQGQSQGAGAAGGYGGYGSGAGGQGFGAGGQGYGNYGRGGWGGNYGH